MSVHLAFHKFIVYFSSKEIKVSFITIHAWKKKFNNQNFLSQINIQHKGAFFLH